MFGPHPGNVKQNPAWLWGPSAFWFHNGNREMKWAVMFQDGNSAVRLWTSRPWQTGFVLDALSTILVVEHGRREAQLIPSRDIL
jgi:hypothetical protein